VGHSGWGATLPFEVIQLFQARSPGSLLLWAGLRVFRGGKGFRIEPMDVVRWVNFYDAQAKK